MLSELGISKGQVIRFAVLPQIFPRLKNIFGGGLFCLPYLLLVVFSTVRIIPRNHPALRYENRNQYSLFQVLALAANHLEWTRSNLDKITIFTVILGGIAMLFLQVLLLIITVFTMPALAYNGPGTGPSAIGDFFTNHNNSHDIAFRLLDLIFGIPGIFQSVAITSGEVPTPFHEGMHALFAFYSYGMLLVATLIIVYLVVAIVLETAESGVPFGQRFNKAWAPVRLILFFGLLLPTSSGINMAQYILLYSAKYGSNLATNGWILFGNVAKPDHLVAIPNTPDVVEIAAFMSLVKTCAWAEGQANGRDIQPYFVYGSKNGDVGMDNSIRMAGNAHNDGTPPFPDMVEKAGGKTMFFRFGEKNPTLYPMETGGVMAFCGEIGLTIVDQSQPGATFMQKAYVDMLMCLWDGRTSSAFKCDVPDFDEAAMAFAKNYVSIKNNENPPDLSEHIGGDKRMEIIASLNRSLMKSVFDAVKKQEDEGEWNDGVFGWGVGAANKYGWGGAGIWFNKIAEQNGALSSAVFAKPDIKAMPYVMEDIKSHNEQSQRNLSSMDIYTPRLTGEKPYVFEPPQNRDVALALNKVYKYWGSGDNKVSYRPTEDAQGGTSDTVPLEERKLTGNIMIDFFNMFMGTGGIFDMCKNKDTHPLASMASLGKGLIEHSVRAFVIAGLGTVGGTIMDMMGQKPASEALKAFASFFMTFASLGFVLGILLFYVIPFMPFLYFFFAVMTWVKGIFEAMVGMPLWALAHLRIDGEGMPGAAAADGYFYILEAFVRPIIILISFLGGIMIFTAVVKVLNETFYLVLANLSGHHAVGSAGCFQPPAGSQIGQSVESVIKEQDFQRGTIDQFFYTVIYTVIVYMMSVPCFKLVDLIPDKIMKWLGTGISSFGASDGDPASQLMSHISGGMSLLALKKGLGQ